jgi:2-phosphoglycerate kinase
MRTVFYVFIPTGGKFSTMNKQTNRSIYIISGPYGVGKSTIAQELAQRMEKVALIEGDLMKLMFGGKEQSPWEEQLSIIWENILCLTKNFIENNMNVIIDYVVESELEWFYKHISKLNANIYYVVLRADEDIIIKRLSKRGDVYLIEGSLYLLDKIEKLLSNEKYLYDTTNKQPVEIINDLQSRFEQFCL